MLNKMLKLARQCNKPMGGLQVIFCGDFFQLPPVSIQKALPAMFSHNQPTQSRHMQDTTAYCFESPVWASLFGDRCFELHHVYRQQQDSEFVSILHEIRHGVLTPEAAAVINGCVGRSLDCSDGILPTQIFIYRYRCSNLLQIEAELIWIETC